MWQIFAGFIGLPPKPVEYTLGYEKDPWCMAYVGVKAKTKPKIPFAPADFELSARSFAKPFGGKIGPWYFKSWPATSTQSVGSNDPNQADTKTDPFLPQRLEDASKVDDINKMPMAANYSRFVGDKFGLTSIRVAGQYIKAIHQQALKTSNVTLFRLGAFGF